MMSNIVMPAYTRLPIHFERGDGPWLYDRDGKQYLDALSGIAVTILGHNHPKFVDAITTQVQKVLHVSNGFEIPEQQHLATKLAQVSGMDQAFFCNSGAEANEAAIKLARLYGHNKGIKNPNIIVMEKSFHGRTLATLSASGNRKIQAGFEPLVAGFTRAPYDDIAALEQIIEAKKDIVAIMLEPIQCNGGIVIPQAGYLQAIRKLCDQHDLLMILDEVQTGVGHTGKYFAYQHEDCVPDVLALAKALGNGYPIGACLAQGKAVDVITAGKHGTTLGGNPLACLVGSTVLQIIEDENLLDNAATLGDYLHKGLQETLASYACVRDIRSKGLLFGIELDRPCKAIRQIGVEQGIIFNVAAEKVIRFIPPLIINREHADMIITRLEASIKKYLREHAHD